MEPLKLIYDGYEIEIRSGGESMPIVTMRKMVTNTPEPDLTIKLPRTIKATEYPKWWETVPSWWENPPMWWYNPSVTWSNEDSLHFDNTTDRPYSITLTNCGETSDTWGDPSGKYTEMGE